MSADDFVPQPLIFFERHLVISHTRLHFLLGALAVAFGLGLARPTVQLVLHLRRARGHDRSQNDYDGCLHLSANAT